MRRFALVTLVAAVGAAGPPTTAIAAPVAGSPDPSWGTRGLQAVPVGQWGAATSTALQPDGRLVTAGEASLGGGRYALISTRMLPNGSLDRSYGTGGTVELQVGGPSGGNSVAIAPDGRIVLAGFGQRGGHLAFAAVRLRGDGRLDPSFGSGGEQTVVVGSGAIANSVLIEPDGRIVLAGTSAKIGATASDNAVTLVRLTAAGQIDRSFGTGGIARLAAPAAAWGMARQRDGRIIVAGQSNAPPTGDLFTTLLQAISGTQVFLVARVLPSGTLDPGFGRNGVVHIPVGEQAIGDAVAIEPDGRIVVAGSAFAGRAIAAVARLLPSGANDPAFGAGGLTTFALGRAINAVTIAPGNRILLAGSGPTAIRLTARGGLDPSFGTGGIVAYPVGQNDAANAVAIQADGGILLAGCTEVGGRLMLSAMRLVS